MAAIIMQELHGSNNMVVQNKHTHKWARLVDRTAIRVSTQGFIKTV